MTLIRLILRLLGRAPRATDDLDLAAQERRQRATALYQAKRARVVAKRLRNAGLRDGARLADGRLRR